MSSTRVFKEALFDYLGSGLQPDFAFIQALVLYRTHLGVIPGPAAAHNSAVAAEYIQRMLEHRGDRISDQIGFIVNDEDESIVKIPDADCMARHLPG